MEQTEISVQKIEEAGYSSAMLGLSLNKNQSPLNMPVVSEILANKGMGHNKFLESICIWLDVRAPRYWWQNADTYRISTKQSESTNHTALKKYLTTTDFENQDIDLDYLEYLNSLISIKDFLTFKRKLPEGFMQRRIWCMSYKTFQNIAMQRWDHKLPHWRKFVAQVMKSIEHPELISKGMLDDIRKLSI